YPRSRTRRRADADIRGAGGGVRHGPKFVRGRREAEDAERRRREDLALEAVRRARAQDPPRRPRRVREVVGHRVQRPLDAAGRAEGAERAQLASGEAEVGRGQLLVSEGPANSTGLAGRALAELTARRDESSGSRPPGS